MTIFSNSIVSLFIVICLLSLLKLINPIFQKISYFMYYLDCRQDRILIKQASQIYKTLCIEINPIKIVQNHERLDPMAMNTFDCLLGIRYLRQQAFLIISNNVYPICTFQGSTIREIKQIQWIPICTTDMTSIIMQEYRSQMQQINKIFQVGYHYYSDTYDLSSTYKMNKKKIKSYEQIVYTEQFIWNKALMNFQHSQILPLWCRPITQGYIQTFSCFLPGQIKIIYLLMSRRSNKKAGTRFFARGINDQGYVANYTQTQQILMIQDNVFSNVQLRGSVPAFFQQTGVNGLVSQLNIQRNTSLTKLALFKHFERIKQIYHRVLCVNLLSLKKPQEQKLSDFYEKLISQTNFNYVRYQYFDFHQECKGDKFENSVSLIEKLQKVIDVFDFDWYSTKKKIFQCQQTGVFRTNCLDCLDRTNYIQYKIALKCLQNMLHAALSQKQWTQILEKKVFDFFEDQQYGLISNFSLLWADNGDAISNHYTGIGSTHTDITKTGKRTLLGTINHKMRSLMRFYTQFTDVKKHEAIDNWTNSTNHKLVNQKSILISVSQHDAYLISWNITKKSPPSSFFSFFKLKTLRTSFVVISLHYEYDKTILGSIKNIFQKRDNQHVDEWLKFFSHELQLINYIKISELMIAGNCLLTFALQQVGPLIGQIKSEKSQNSSGSFLILKFHIHQSSLVFISSNCQNYQIFFDMIKQNYKNAFQVYKLGLARSSSIIQQNYKTILGNIGSQSLMQQQQKQILLSKMKSNTILPGQSYKLIASWLDKDQFTMYSYKHEYVRDLTEGPVNFLVKNNRILFQNHQSLIVKVLDYRQIDEDCVIGHYNYEVKIKR